MKHDEKRPTQDSSGNEVQARAAPASGRATLGDWLKYQEQLHPNTIDMGLERIARVLSGLDWRKPVCPILTVGGTNGKGSCVAILESILSRAGYRVGTFTSPHLVRYNERIRVAGREASDEELVAAFERIEGARQDISITFFEFNTLAALVLFEASNLDAWILEVGLGGRLDAVNVVDADVAVVTSIAMDHCEWLGSDVESIAYWKAGIFRAGRPAIFGSYAMPATIQREADRVGAPLVRLGVDFKVEQRSDGWDWLGREALLDLPMPGLTGVIQLENAATALAALDCLRDRLPLSRSAVVAGLQDVRLNGRFEVLPAGRVGAAEWILDVAHNPAAAATLARNLEARPCAGKTIAVCGMLADKDVNGVVSALTGKIDGWVIATVSGARALAGARLADCVNASGGRVAGIAVDVEDACARAQALVVEGDRIVVFGSFHTVGPASDWLRLRH